MNAVVQTARLMMDNCKICSNVHENLCMVMKKKNSVDVVDDLYRVH